MNKFIYTAKVPSNIAFIKYWGKRNEQYQWPTNDSLSMTLNTSLSKTSAQKLTYGDFIVSINEEIIPRQSSQGAKIFSYLDFLADHLGTKEKLSFSSYNTFPSACGIASSASGMGALTIAAIAAWKDAHSMDDLAQKGFDSQQLAALARKGSGSACRSMMGGFVKWEAGATKDEQKVTQIFTPNHWSLNDIIVILDDNKKKTSSTKGHRAALQSPLFQDRLAQLPARLEQISSALKNRDLDALGVLLEEEALDMHRVVESSPGGITYMSTKTHSFISFLRQARKNHKIKAYFTCDAGPNLHLIAEESTTEKLIHLIQTEFDANIKILVDNVGEGPTLTANTEHDGPSSAGV